MVTEVLSVLYFSVGMLVFYKSIEYFEEKNKDGDPEGLDALASLGAACFWPVTIPIFVLYKLFRG